MEMIRYDLILTSIPKIYFHNFQTSYENGELILTTHRFLWGRPGDIPRGMNCLSLPLKYIVFIEEEVPSAFSFSKSKKLLLHLTEPDAGQ